MIGFSMMQITDADREKLKKWPVDLLLSNSHEQYAFSDFIEEYENSDPKTSFSSLFSKPAKPIAVGNSYALLPFYKDLNKQLIINYHHFSPDRKMLHLFFDWHLSDKKTIHHFSAICLKLNHRGLYAATICHELFPNPILGEIINVKKVGNDVD
jgi:hypothetical protein